MALVPWLPKNIIMLLSIALFKFLHFLLLGVPSWGFAFLRDIFVDGWQSLVLRRSFDGTVITRFERRVTLIVIDLLLVLGISLRKIIDDAVAFRVNGELAWTHSRTLGFVVFDDVQIVEAKLDVDFPRWQRWLALLLTQELRIQSRDSRRGIVLV